MQERILDKIAEPFNIELPTGDTMQSMLDEVLPAIRKRSEDLNEEEYYLNRSWIEMSDDVEFNEIWLFRFEEGGQLRSFRDGESEMGSWENLGENKMTMGSSFASTTLYTLAFLDGDFLVLKRYGNLENIDGAKYRMFVREALATKLDWREAIEYLVNKYKSVTTPFIALSLFLILMIILFFVLSYGGIGS